MIDTDGFFGRVCSAFGIDPGRGAKAYIAKETDNSPTAVGKWEDGEIPGLDNIEKIAIKTNSSLHWLLTGVGPHSIDELKAAEEQILDRASLERFVRRIVREEIGRKGAPSFGIGGTEKEKQVG